MSEIDSFYFKKEEPVRSCLLALKDLILSQDEEITSTWKYGMPFFCFRGKMFCYLWVHKKYKHPYIGIVEGKHFNDPDLITENRSRMKILLIDPTKDLPNSRIEAILQKVINLFQSGAIKIN